MVVDLELRQLVLQMLSAATAFIASFVVIVIIVIIKFRSRSIQSCLVLLTSPPYLKQAHEPLSVSQCHNIVVVFVLHHSGPVINIIIICNYVLN